MNAINEVNSIRSIVLTGGRSARSLYNFWKEQPSESISLSAKYFTGDERCVSTTDEESNYKVMKLLFGKNILLKNLIAMRGKTKDPEREAIRYSSLLPDSVDVVLLSVGEDGHIASIFPYSKTFESDMKIHYISDAPKFPSDRLTITPKVLNQAKNIIVFAIGAKKGKILAKGLSDPSNFRELPVRLTIGKTWVFDREAYKAFKETNTSKNMGTKIIYE